VNANVVTGADVLPDDRGPNLTQVQLQRALHHDDNGPGYINMAREHMPCTAHRGGLGTEPLDHLGVDLMARYAEQVGEHPLVDARDTRGMACGHRNQGIQQAR